MAGSRIRNFDKIDLIFKTVNEHPLYATILTPTVRSSWRVSGSCILARRRVLLGHRLHEAWFPLW